MDCGRRSSGRGSGSGGGQLAGARGSQQEAAHSAVPTCEIKIFVLTVLAQALCTDLLRTLSAQLAALQHCP